MEVKQVQIADFTAPAGDQQIVGDQQQPQQTTWQQRVVLEREELSGRIDRLKAFLANNPDAGSLLPVQLRHMRAYLDVLDQRIAKF